MDENNNIKIDFSEIDKILERLAEGKSYSQGDLFYDDNLITSTASAATISTAASNIWPYTYSGSYNCNLGSINSNVTNGINFNDLWSSTSPGLKVNGDAEFDGDVKIKGKSISESLEKIEQRLGILYPNEKLEEKWEELKALGDKYRELEKDILEKEKIWETLKK